MICGCNDNQAKQDFNVPDILQAGSNAGKHSSLSILTNILVEKSDQG
jgi:hypothetical protein